MVPWPFGKERRALKQARHAVEVAQRVSTLVAVETLCDALDVGLALPQDLALIERLLTQLQPTARALLGSILDTLATSFDNDARFGLWGSRGAQIVERMCRSYEALLERRLEPVEPELLASALWWLTRRLLLLRLADEHMLGLPWPMLLGALRGGGQLPDAEHLPEPVRLALAELLLANIALRRLPERAPCFAVMTALTGVLPLLLINNAFSRVTPWILLPDNEGMPRRLEAWQMPDQDGLALFCGLQPLLHVLDEQCRRADASEPVAVEQPVPPAGTPVDPLEGVRNLRLVLAPLADVEDDFADHRPSVLAAFDFMRIRVLLSTPVRQAPKREQLIRSVDILDMSSQGCELLLEPESDCARRGGLVALQQSGGWWIGVVRRLLPEADGRQLVGVHFLSRQPVPARFLLISADERHVLDHAIVLPDGHGQRGQILLAQLSVQPGVRYVLDIERQERNVLIEHVLDAGEGYVLLSFSYSEADAPVA